MVIRAFADDVQEQAPYLGVQRSATGRVWRERLTGHTTRYALAIAQRHGVPEAVARVAAARGVTPDEAPAWLDPSLKTLMPEPCSLAGMEVAANRIAKAIRDGEQIALLGDYDVDGASSVALVARFLRHFGLDPFTHIPDRLIEGYGPSLDAVRRLRSAGATLLVTLDCGSTSYGALDEAKAVGFETVVIDHHQMDEKLPEAVAVVNPNRPDCLSGQGHLSAAGVAFLVLVAINRVLRKSAVHAKVGEPPLLDWLEIVALSTVCDVVPLIGLNRAYVTKGLIAMRRRRLAGLAALADVSRLTGPPNCYHLGFLLGPRINAGGRIGDAGLGARLLQCDDPDESRAIAAHLDRLNAERQTVESIMVDQAAAAVEKRFSQFGERPVVLVSESAEAWHPGVIGLVAARLKERYQRPAFALAVSANGTATGSGRSIPGVNIGAAVRDAVAAGLLIKGGGHAMAAGLTVAAGRINELEVFLSEHVSDSVASAQAETSLELDGALSARAATTNLIEALERAGPYGAGNPAPCFALPAHRVVYADQVGTSHVRLRLASGDGATLEGIAFRAAAEPLGRMLLSSRGSALHIAGRMQIDHWNGNARPKLHVDDAAPA